MNAATQPESTALAVAPDQQFDLTQLDAASLILGPSWDRIQAFGKMMARGSVTIPRHLQGNEADCTAVALQAFGWRMNPYAVAQKTHISQSGALGYEAQLVNAVIQGSGALQTDPDYEYVGDWSKVLGKVEERKSDKGGKYYVATYTKADEDGLGVIVRAQLRGESKMRELTVMMSQAYPRFSTQWATDPKQQISYLALRKFVRLHKPGVILGVYTNDEMEAPGEKFMGSAEVVSTPAPPPPAPPPPAAWPDDKLAQRFPKYQEWLAAGKTHDEIIAFAETKGTLSEAQKKKIRALKAPAGAKADAAKVDPTTGEVTDAVPKVTYAQVADKLHAAQDRAQLAAAAELIAQVADEQQRAELTTIHARRDDELPF
ncbi:recombinase RecT [Variovorax sp. LjRoot84]|uniref:RecT family recombinase n=1 Tax=Variovorax sp. LjRoot84 TaxID=3342340 RepID=UPI003ED07677